MTWLMGEIWLWMVLAALVGAALTGFFSTTEVRTERWVPTPVPDEQDPAHTSPLSAASSAPTAKKEEALASPFPEVRTTSGPRSWAEEELWSRPVAPEEVRAEQAREPEERTEASDEWERAADSWRDWALEMTSVEAPVGAGAETTDEAHRDVPTADPQPHAATDPQPHAVTAPAMAEPEAGHRVEADGAPVIDIVAELEAEGGLEASSDTTLEGADAAAARGDAEAAEMPAAEVPVEEEPAEERLAEEPAAPVAELSAAERIRDELARLEAEMAERERRKRELLEAERADAEHAVPGLAVTVVGASKQDEAPTVPPTPARKPRKRATTKAAPVTEAVAETVIEKSAEQAEAERLEVERLEAERAARAKARAQRAAATRARNKAQREETERLEAERLEVERLEAERAEVEQARRKAERAAAARARAKVKREEAARLKAERAEAERLEAERVQAQDLEDAVVADQLPVAGATLLEPSDDSDEWKQGPFGPGSAYAAFDGSAPRGYSIKANVATRLYHSRQSRFYSRTHTDVWFDNEESAEAAGFVRWDQRGSKAHTVAQHHALREGPAA